MRLMKYNCILSLLILFQVKQIYPLIPPSQFIHNHPKLAIDTINYLTTKLPMLDTVGHKNLEFNKEVIPTILNNENIPTFIKSEAVTGLIKFSQFGDNFGGWVIENYLQIITYLVNSL